MLSVNDNNGERESGDGSEFAAFNNLAGILISVPIQEIRSKLGKLRNRGTQDSTADAPGDYEEQNRKDPG